MSESLTHIDEAGVDELKKLLLQVLEANAQFKRENPRHCAMKSRDCKGLNGKPDVKPSGMEKKAKPRSGKKGGRKKPRCRGSKNDKLTIDESKILKPDNIPEGSKFKGYEDYLVQDLILRPWTVLYRRQRLGKTPQTAKPLLGNCLRASAAISVPALSALRCHSITNAG